MLHVEKVGLALVASCAVFKFLSHVFANMSYLYLVMGYRGTTKGAST